MISFLTCEAKAVLTLRLTVSYQKKDRIVKKAFEISSDKIYKITVADNMAGLYTYNARITGYTISGNIEELSSVNHYKPTIATVDTIKLDYSEDNVSKTTSINVSDIRYIEELSTSGFDEILNREIPTFK